MKAYLEYFGFSLKKSSTHASRTMMCREMEMLIPFFVENPGMEWRSIRHIILENNILRKKTGKSASICFDKLRAFYGLDEALPLFRILCKLYTHEPESLKQLLLLLAFVRDSVFAACTPFILKLPQNHELGPSQIYDCIIQQFPNKYHESTIKSISRNLLSSWTQVGLVTKQTNTLRIRQYISPSVAAMAYALLLAHLTGHRGLNMFFSDYVRLLDCSEKHAMELAYQASSKGLISFKRIGDVAEVQFPRLLTEKENKLIYEQN